MADDADVRYVIRADDSRLEADLAHAENSVRQSAQRSVAAANSIGESAERANERVSKSTRRAGEETRKTGEETEKTQKKYKSYAEELDEVNRLLEKDGKNTALLSQKKELLSKAIAETSEKLQKLKTRQNEVEQAYKNGDIPDEEYRDFQREIVATEQELRGYQNELNNVGNASEETAEKTESKLGKALGTVGKAAAAASAAVGAAAVAVGTAAVKSADDLDKAVNHVISATGASEDAAEQYAEVIKGVYGDNFGDSFDDIAVSISKITQNLGEMDEVTLQNVTERAYALQDVFDMGVDESARAAKAMAENFGVSAADAYDYIAKGAQDGLDYSGELLDSISEYSVQFAKLGFSADDMFNIFAQGAENGAWNLDKVGDAIKEFSIRAIDGSDTTVAAFQAIGYDADDMAQKFAQGGDVARDAFQKVVNSLIEIEDPVERDSMGVKLFGTMWEDLGVEAVAALGDISDSAYDCAGAMDGIMTVNYSSLSDALGGLKRQAELLIQPLGEALIPAITEVIGCLSEIADQAIPEIVEAVAPLFENIAALVSPLLELISSVLPQLMELITPLVGMVAEIVQTVLPPLTAFLEGSLIPTIIEIVKWVEEKIFPVVMKVIEKLLPPLLNIVGKLLPVITDILDILSPVLDVVLELIDPIADILALLSPVIDALTDIINAALKPLKKLIEELAPVLEEVLGGALKVVSGLITDTLLPAFDGILKFLNGDFMGGIESWGSAFQGAMSNVFSAIDSIFGTHLAQWYNEFNDFWMDMGSKLYQTTHGDEIKMNELGSKYRTMQNDLYSAMKTAIYNGATVEEAVAIAKSKVIDSDEKAYYYSKMADSWNLEGFAQGYFDHKDDPTPVSWGYTTAGSWYAAQYSEYANGSDSGYSAPGAWMAAQYSDYANNDDSPGTSDTGTGSSEKYTYKKYTPSDTDKKDTKKTTSKSSKSSTGGSADSGNFISITSYMPTMWDNDQTAALKSLIGKEVLGNTVSAHQINSLTGAISGTADSGTSAASATAETSLADVVNAITKLQRRVDSLGKDVGDMTIELKARDLTIGKVAVKDINDIAKQSGKSPFNF